MKRRQLSVFALAAFFASAAYAQTGQISGIVSDASGAVIPGTKIAAVNEETGIIHNTTTNEAGAYTVPLLRPGLYEVSAQHEGFRPVSRSGIRIEVDHVARIDFRLQVGDVSERIEVVQTAPLLQTSTSSVGQVIENQQIIDLPLNNRTALGLLGLSAGVVPGRNWSPDNYSAASQFSAGGSRAGQNEFLLDGTPNTVPGIWPGRGILGMLIPVDSIQEFKVQTNSFAAEFGRSGGGLVNSVSKSGTNEMHGSLFWYLRNSAMDSNNFFANRAGVPLVSFKRNQFGGTAGGPFARDRSFFFFNYQGTRVRNPAVFNGTVPTANTRAGNFAGLTTAQGAAITLYDPLTTQIVNGNPIRQPFAGNIIPNDRINQVGRNIAGNYPLPNQPGFVNNYFATATRKTDDDTAGIRVDHMVSDKHKVYGRVYYNQVDPLSPDWYGNEATPGSAYNRQKVYSGTGDYVYTASPTLLLNARYGFTQRNTDEPSRTFGEIDLTTLGFPSAVQTAAKRSNYPAISASGYSAQGWSSGINTFGLIVHSFQGSATKISGNHTIKFGTDVRFHSSRQDRGIDLGGNYTFNNGYTRGPNANTAGATAGDSIASMLLGTPASGSFGTFLEVKGANEYFALYAQDDWRVTSKLTLNLGLRYELELPRTESQDRLDWFDFDVVNPLTELVPGVGTLRGGLRFATVDGNPRRHFNTDAINFAPRFGFAYQATPMTVIRGGSGIFYGAGSIGSGGWNIASQGFAPVTPFVGSIDGFVPITTLGNPFPDGFSQPVGSSRGLLSLVGQNIDRVFDRNALLPYNLQWNFSIQRQFGATLFEIGYIGSQGTHLADGTGHLINQLRPEALQLGTDLQRTVDNPFYGIVTNPGALSQPKVQLAQLLRPYPHFLNMTVFNPSSSSSTYHALTLKFERRYTSGIGFLGSYTWSKNISDSDATVGPTAAHQNTYNRRADRSVIVEDIAHRLILSASAELPFGRNKAVGSGWHPVLNGVLGGWQVNSIISIQSGIPLAFSASPNNLNAQGGTQRPNSNGFSAAKDGRIQDRLENYLNPDAFSHPGPFHYGNVGRVLGDVRGPRLSNLDLSLFKTFFIKEGLRLQARGEFFNAFNSPMFGLPNTAFGGANFGRITSQENDPRQVQLALKLIF